MSITFLLSVPFLRHPSSHVRSPAFDTIFSYHRRLYHMKNTRTIIQEIINMYLQSLC